MIRPIPFSLAQARYDSQEQECWRDEELDLARTERARCPSCGKFYRRYLGSHPNRVCPRCEENEF